MITNVISTTRINDQHEIAMKLEKLICPRPGDMGWGAGISLVSLTDWESIEI